MEDRLRRLAVKFRQQQEFATDYSPLYARLFGAVAGWLQSDGDPVVDWLLRAGEGRHSLEITLLLAAGLHRDVLAGDIHVADLARYFPTVGGAEPLTDPAFEETLRQAILIRSESLATFIQTVKVQTNETGRGLCWLLPLSFTGWKSVHLVDLGASAGLNLAAERRAYRLVQEPGGQPLLDLGLGQPVQFVTRCRGHLGPLDRSTLRGLPQVASRTGCDLSPYYLDSVDAEHTLLAFVWGDHVERLERLQEGIEILKQVQESDVPVRLFPVNMPRELPPFLAECVPESPSLPVVVYNTYVTNYLADKGASLRHHIGSWAATQNRPVLWLQWEVDRDDGVPAQDYRCAWTADLWHGSRTCHWQIGWVHPHGTEAEFEPGFDEWAAFWSG